MVFSFPADMVSSPRTFTLDLLGMGEVITSFLTESRDGTEFARAECERRCEGFG